MLVSTLFATSVVLSSVPQALGYPGMNKQIDEIKIKVRESAEEGDSYELIGDLLTLPDSQLTSVGKDIKQVLQGGDGQSSATYSNVPAITSAKCGADTCCIWKYIADDMAATFKGKSGRCNKFARMAVRLGFHDAGAWSKSTTSQGLGGGADGSMCLTDEINRSDNNGLQDIVVKMQQWYDVYHNQKGYKSVTYADLIQMGATVATVVCPLGPRIKSYVGRKDSAVANPTGLLPSPFQSADDLIALFADKTIAPNGLVALVGSHTTSQQEFVNVTRSGDPQDSTPGVWDVLFYGQTLGTSSTPKRVFKFQSDIALSQHAKTKDEWKGYASGKDAQSDWTEVSIPSSTCLQASCLQ
jgi:hypothetical protein